MRERRGRLTADNRRGLVDELVVLDGRHHEEGKVHATRDVAFKDRVAHVPAPHWQALAIALLEVAPAHNGPPRVACKYPPACLNLVVEVHDARLRHAGGYLQATRGGPLCAGATSRRAI